MQEYSVYGLGSGGSKVVDMLARHSIMGQRKAVFNLYDPDTVDQFNVYNQLYTLSDILCPKISAVKRHLERLELKEGRIITVNINQEDLEPRGVTLVMVDSMAGRKKIYNLWKEAMFTSSVLIENRLDAEVVKTYCVTRHTESKRRYENTLYDDPPADPNRDVCKVRESSYISTLNAVLAVKYALEGGEGCPFETQIGLGNPIQILVRP
jgi:hypothetical protein